MKKQKNYYSLKEVMERLGFQSLNAFRRLERKYPDVFTNVNPNTQKNRYHWYDKAAVDKFADQREQIQ